MNDDFHLTGVTPDQIAKAGTINEWDDAATIRTKVMVSEALTGANPPVGSNDIVWGVLPWLVFIIFTGLLIAVPNFLKYSWPEDDVYAAGDYAVSGASTLEKERTEYLNRSPGLTALFLPDAPLKKIFDGCTKKCSLPDLRAFAAFRKYGKATTQEEYEDKICRTAYDAGSLSKWMSPKAVYTFDFKNNVCAVGNVREVNRAIREHNHNLVVIYWPWTLWLLALIGTIKWYRKI